MDKLKARRDSPVQIAGALMFINLVAKAFGFLRETLLANYYGAGAVSDAYITANNIPTILFASIGAALSTTYIPLHSRISVGEGEEQAAKFTDNLAKCLIAVCFAATVLGEIFAEQFVSLFASGFSGETFDLTVDFTRILFPSIFVIALMNIMGSFLQLKGEYLAIGVVPIPASLITIISLLVSYYLGDIYILVWGTLIGTASQIVFYSFYLKRRGLTFILSSDPPHRDPNLKKLGLMAVPVFLGESLNEANAIINRRLISSLDEGSVSSLNYAYKLFTLLTGILIVSAITYIYPKLSERYSKGHIREYASLIERSLNAFCAITLPVCAAILALSPLIVRIAFERGSFDAEASAKTSDALIFYGIGLVAAAFRETLNKSVFAANNTKIPMINGVVFACVSIPLNIFLIGRMGINGAALSLSIVSALSGLSLLLIVRRKFAPISLLNISLSFLKSLLASLPVWAILSLSRRLLAESGASPVREALLTALALIICAAVFLTVQIILKNKIVTSLFKFPRRK